MGTAFSSASSVWIPPHLDPPLRSATAHADSSQLSPHPSFQYPDAPSTMAAAKSASIRTDGESTRRLRQSTECGGEENDVEGERFPAGQKLRRSRDPATSRHWNGRIVRWRSKGLSRTCVEQLYRYEEQAWEGSHAR